MGVVQSAVLSVLRDEEPLSLGGVSGDGKLGHSLVVELHGIIAI